MSHNIVLHSKTANKVHVLFHSELLEQRDQRIQPCKHISECILYDDNTVFVSINLYLV